MLRKGKAHKRRAKGERGASNQTLKNRPSEAQASTESGGSTDACGPDRQGPDRERSVPQDHGRFPAAHTSFPLLTSSILPPSPSSFPLSFLSPPLFLLPSFLRLSPFSFLPSSFPFPFSPSFLLSSPSLLSAPTPRPPRRPHRRGGRFNPSRKPTTLIPRASPGVNVTLNSPSDTDVAPIEDLRHPKPHPLLSYDNLLKKTRYPNTRKISKLLCNAPPLFLSLLQRHVHHAAREWTQLAVSN